MRILLFIITVILITSSAACTYKESGYLILRNETPFFLVGKTYTTDKLTLDENFAVSPNDKIILARFNLALDEQSDYLRQLVQLQIQSNECVIYLDEREIYEVTTGGPNLVINVKPELFSDCKKPTK